MPNWCENDLTIKGPDKDEILRSITGEGTLFDFNGVIPYPKKFREQDEKHKANPKEVPHDGYNSGGYEWCIENWGTKWNACKTREISDGLTFDTAWAPPGPVIEQLSKMWPENSFTLKYYERGAGFSGMSSHLRVTTEIIVDVEAAKLARHNLTNGGFMCHDFAGACAPGKTAVLRSQDTFSVGIFEWLPKKSEEGWKRSAVKVRVKGSFHNPDAVYEKAKEIVKALDAGTYNGPKNVIVK